MIGTKTLEPETVGVEQRYLEIIMELNWKSGLDAEVLSEKALVQIINLGNIQTE